METIGILKDVDKLGRIVVPKEFRERYALGDKVEVIPTKEGVLIRNPKYILVKSIEREDDEA